MASTTTTGHRQLGELGPDLLGPMAGPHCGEGGGGGGRVGGLMRSAMAGQLRCLNVLYQICLSD